MLKHPKYFRFFGFLVKFSKIDKFQKTQYIFCIMYKIYNSNFVIFAIFAISIYFIYFVYTRIRPGPFTLMEDRHVAFSAQSAVNATWGTDSCPCTDSSSLSDVSRGGCSTGPSKSKVRRREECLKEVEPQARDAGASATSLVVKVAFSCARS